MVRCMENELIRESEKCNEYQLKRQRLSIRQILNYYWITLQFTKIQFSDLVREAL